MDGPVERSNSCFHNNCGEAAHEHEHEHKHENRESCLQEPVNHFDSETSAPTIATVPRNHIPETVFSRVVGLMDIAGVCASTLCTVHCILLPLLVLILPVLAKPLLKHDWVHIGLAGFVFTFCLMAFIPGYLKHRDARLLWLGGLGITLVFFATFVARQWGEVVEASVITAGNTVIIFCHLLNRKLLAHLKCQHHH